MPVNEAELQKSLVEFRIPSTLHGGILRWISKGIPPGGFLKRIIENDARAAAMWADPQNIAHVDSLLMWFTLKAPAECWGSNANILNWLAQHRADRDTKRKEEHGTTSNQRSDSDPEGDHRTAGE